MFSMFNVIVRQSKEEIPTYLTLDPISDTRVLPIPTGNVIFGASA